MDGVHLSYQEYIYYVFHKPKGCVCANYDALHDTVFSYVPMNPKEDLFTVGRLDMDTEGLLLITNDGEFSHNLLSPKKHVDKTYFALWDKPATEEDWGTEYLDYVISAKTVSSLDEAIDHINRYNTGHSEAIITNDYSHAERFLDEVDAACV